MTKMSSPSLVVLMCLHVCELQYCDATHDRSHLLSLLLGFSPAELLLTGRQTVVKRYSVITRHYFKPSVHVEMKAFHSEPQIMLEGRIYRRKQKLKYFCIPARKAIHLLSSIIAAHLEWNSCHHFKFCKRVHHLCVNVSRVSQAHLLRHLSHQVTEEYIWPFEIWNPNILIYYNKNKRKAAKTHVWD